MSFTLDDEDDGLDDLISGSSAPVSTAGVAPNTSLPDVSIGPDEPYTEPPSTLPVAASASFNIDEFLDSPAAHVSPAAPAVSTGDQSFSLDDFLGDSPARDAVSVSVPAAEAPAASGTAPAEPTVSAVPPSVTPHDDDFLSWLDDATQDKQKDTAESQPVASAPAVSATDNKSPVTPSSVLPPIAPHSGTMQKSQKKIKYESDLLKIITSGFPDVAKIQGLIAANGYIPRELRGQVWCLLLSGTCSEDQEADFWQSTGLELPNHAAVVSDCDAVIEKCRRRGLSLPAAAFEQAKRDLVDILVLYCVRRTIPYKPLYCDLLAPMLVSMKPLSRTVASSCFYSLCSEFIPVVNLPVIQQEKTSEKLHELLKLLLRYHYPKLTSHLDRMLKGWEKRTNSISAAMAIKFDAAARDRLELDELERDFGLSLPGGDSEAASAAAGSAAAQDAEEGRGRIPENWLYCVFGAALPLELSCWMWDWVLSTGDKFSGIYLVVALFGIYSESLREMSGTQICEWLDNIATGSSDQWYSKLPIKFPGDSGAAVVNTLSWESFARGWIHAAEAVRNATPTSFQASLNSIEKWGQEPALSESSQHGGAASGLDSSTGSDRVGGLDRSANKDSVPPLPGSSHGGGSSLIIERLRRLSVQMQKPPEGGATSEGLRGRFSRVLGSGNGVVDGGSSDSGYRVGVIPGHFTPQLSSRCLWANVAEVIPSLCSSSKQRQAIPAEKKVLLSFRAGAVWTGADESPISDLASPASADNRSRSNSMTSQESSEGSASADRGGEGFVIPLMAGEKDQPFYFGIDCRAAENEISLGKFPKAYCLDPADLKDSYMISTILRTLEPMANQFHFCIMGVGEEFFVHRAAALAAKAGKGRALTEAPSVETLKAEYFQGVAAVIDFFEKRDFKHVSFLEGGITSAIRFLMKEECPYSISSSLVDVEPDTLDAVFGQGTASAYLNIRRGTSGALGGIGATSMGTASGTSGAAAFLSSLSKADIFANGSNEGDVVEVAAPQTKPAASGSGLLSFISKKPQGPSTGISSEQSSGTERGNASDPASNASASGQPAQGGERLGELKSKMSIFGSNTLASLRRVSQSVGNGANNGGNVGTSSGVTADDGVASAQKPIKKMERESSASAFVIDDDEDEDGDSTPDGGPVTSANPSESNKGTFITRVGGAIRSTGLGGSSEPAATGASGSIARLQGGGLVDIDPDKIGVSKTEAEKAQALAMHKLAGVVKGDQITINRESLPGALLFPARKIKMVPVPKSDDNDKEDEMKEELFHRYIVVTKERVIVLDSGGGGVGSLSTVKSNHHLTELVKLTFKKRDPELLTLFVANSMPMMPDEDENGDDLDEKQRGGAKPIVTPKQKQYRVTKRDELVEVLQKYMKRFR